MSIQELGSRRKTKIVCTIGPATSSKVMLLKLVKSGMDCARINFSHGTHEEHLTTINRVREVSRELGRHVAIIQDLPGPKFRIGNLANNGVVHLTKGSTITLVTDSESSSDDSRIPLRQQGLPRYVSHGTTIFLADGTIRLRVLNTSETEIRCRVVVGGDIYSGKGVNIPRLGKDFETFTEADKHHAIFGVENDVDLIAVSFVRSAKDIESVRKFVESHYTKKRTREENPPWIIAKIEKREALVNLEEIIQASDVVMVARGDLGVENPIEKVPIIQKKIISRCNVHSIPVITATQMLESMVENPTPTRAEVADVANAILDGTDSVMLSEETAVGKYPLECVSVLHRVSLNTEEKIEREGFRGPTFDYGSADDSDETSLAAISMSQDLGGKFLICPTENGKPATRLSKFKPTAPIIALTSRQSTARRLKVSWGVQSMIVRLDRTRDSALKGARKLDEIIETSIRTLSRDSVVSVGDKLILFVDSVEFFGHTGKLIFVTESEMRN